MTKRALITGITDKDGSYLAELMLSKGDEVHGVIRRASTFETARIGPLYVDRHEPGAQGPSPASSATRARFCRTTPSRTAHRRTSSTSPSSPEADWTARIPPDSVNAVAVVRRA